MLRSLLVHLRTLWTSQRDVDAARPDLAELGLQDPVVARRLKRSGVALEQFAPLEPAFPGPRPTAALTPPLRILLPLVPVADAAWLEQAWMWLRAHGLQLELVAPASDRDPSARRADLAACDLVLLPSWQDGSLAALVEAAAMARPVICVDVPEARELIRHGRDGLLVPMGNAQALLLAVQLLVRQPAFMDELGQRLQHKVVAAYQLVDDLDRTLETYRRLVPLEQGESL